MSNLGYAQKENSFQFNQLCIGYLGRILPVLSETFVVREINALRQLGADVRPFSIYKPNPAEVHPEFNDILKEVDILVRPANPIFWFSHMYCALRSPRRFFQAIWRNTLGAKETFKRRLRSLVHFGAAPYASLRFRHAGLTHVHAHFASTPGSIAMMAAELAGISFSFTAHAYDIFVDDLLLGKKLKSARFVITISEFNKDYLRQHYQEASESQIEIVHCGVDYESFVPRQLPRKETPAIFAMGRLVETKGFHTLIEACSRLHENGVKIQCLIAGDGPESERLQKLITDLRLEKHVYLLGKLLQPDVIEYYRSANIFAMPSCVRNNDRDGIPVVLMEAMAMEIPCIATRVSGIPELVRHEETGLLVDPDDPAALAEALSRLLRDTELAGRLAKAGRELVIREFDIEKNASELMALFSGTRKT
ncbi:MAG: glycosyltransferase family 4 protein [Candidatus Aminicenantes bacterium]|nr:MAG: glycosyltransferase family 4 protein [Candidatus Aminicenantes bacterium]